MPLTVNSQTQCTWNNSGFTWNDISANQNWNANYIYVWTQTEPETLALAEDDVLGITSVSAETLNLVDAFLQGQSVNFDEPVNFAEALVTIGTFSLTLAETLAFAEAVAKLATVVSQESFSVEDLMMRQGPVVIGNLTIRNDLLSFATFLTKIGDGVSGAWLPYRPFVPGDYDFMRALVRVTLTRDNVNQDVKVVTGKIYADMADVVESRTTTIVSAAAPTSLTFDKTFVAVPVVSATLVSTSANAKARISNVTKTGFDLEIIDETNTRLTGVVGWQARGY